MRELPAAHLFRRIGGPSVAAAFFASGFSALVYQVCWQRILALHSGVGIYSVAMIVAAFLAGLGVGSHLGGLLSTRLDRRRSLVAFVVLELAVGGFGLASPRLYYDTLYLGAGWLYAPAWRAGLLHFVALLPPTVLMGMSLPLLVRARVADTSRAARTIGGLYAVNTLGAAAGALAAPWWLIRFSGVEGALLAGALGNGVAATLATLAALMRRVGPEAEAIPEPPHMAPPLRRHPFPLWLALYGASGFVALSLEILWFRIVDVAVKATAFTFGTVLAFYLAGLAIGSLAGARVADRLTRPLRVFLGCQCLILLTTGLAVLLLAWLPPDLPLYRWYVELWRGEHSFNLNGPWRSGPFVRLYVLLPALLCLVPTLLMGFSFPVLQRAVQDDAATSGRKVGLLQAANIAGNVAGSLLTGLVLLNGIGVTGSLRALLGAGTLFAVAGMVEGGWRRGFTAAAAALVAVSVAQPGQHRFWLRLHGSDTPRALIREDASSVVALVPAQAVWRVWVNGKTDSVLPFGGIHTLIGAVPALIHPAPGEVAVVGLTSGDTAWAAGCRSETGRVSVFELCGPQLGLLRRLAVVEPPPKLSRFLNDPRYRILQADGRNALERGNRRYDVIAVDGSRPSTAYSGHLYSVQFLDLCAHRLKPGGVLGLWAPSERVVAGVSQVFPHVLALPEGPVLVASRQRFEGDLAAWRQRLARPEVMAYFGSARARGIGRSLRSLAPPPPGTAAPNQDLFPRDEFNSP